MTNEDMLKLILSKFDNMENRFDSLEKDVKQLKTEIETISLTVNRMDKDLTEVKENTKILEKTETKKFLKTGSKIVSLLSE